MWIDLERLVDRRAGLIHVETLERELGQCGVGFSRSGIDRERLFELAGGFGYNDADAVTPTGPWTSSTSRSASLAA